MTTFREALKYALVTQSNILLGLGGRMEEAVVVVLGGSFTEAEIVSPVKLVVRST